MIDFHPILKQFDPIAVDALFLFYHGKKNLKIQMFVEFKQQFILLNVY